MVDDAYDTGVFSGGFLNFERPWVGWFPALVCWLLLELLEFLGWPNFYSCLCIVIIVF